jgi:erythromycin esterase-like protein
VAADEFFFAEQNERLVKNAEEHYRSMFRKRDSSWNLRDRHMADTLEHLAGFLTGQGQHAKIIVWEHNSHLGDARATEMRDSGEKLTLLERYAGIFRLHFVLMRSPARSGRLVMTL